MILACIGVTVWAAGCRGSKGLTKTEEHTAKRDSTATSLNKDSLWQATLEDLVGYYTTKETTIQGVPGVRLIYTEAKDDDRDTIIRKGPVSLQLYTDRKGRRHIECNMDSLLRVVNRMTVDSTRARRQYDSLYATKSLVDKRTVSADSTTLKQVVAKETEGFWLSVRNELVKGLAFIVVAVMFFFLGKFSPRLIKFLV